MKQGKWFLYFEVEARGFNSIGENMGPTYLKRKIKIRLLRVSNETEAADQAKFVWVNRSFDSIPPEYRGGIERNNDLNFLNPKIVYEGERFERALF